MRKESSALALAHVGLDGIINLDDKNKQTWYPNIVMIEPTSQAYVRKYQVSGFGQAPIVNQGDSIPEDELFTGNQTDYTPKKRGLGFSISTEASESDQYGALRDIGTKLRNSFRRTKEQVYANVINLATSTSQLGPDGKALAANDHPLESGTDSNLFTSAFGALALEDMLESMITQKGHRGDPDPRTPPFFLYVHPSVAAYAARVTDSPLLSGTADNDKNMWNKDRVAAVISSPYFTSVTAWGIRTTDDSEHGLRGYNRRSIRLKSKEDIDLDAFVFRATEIYVAGVEDWRGFAYSSG